MSQAQMLLIPVMDRGERSFQLYISYFWHQDKKYSYLGENINLTENVLRIIFPILQETYMLFDPHKLSHVWGSMLNTFILMYLNHLNHNTIHLLHDLENRDFEKSKCISIGTWAETVTPARCSIGHCPKGSDMKNQSYFHTSWIIKRYSWLALQASNESCSLCALITNTL